jgi:hypothetical protein
MLIICCGNFRSGSTLQYQIASAVASSAGRAPVCLRYGLWYRLAAVVTRASQDVVIIKEHEWDRRLAGLDVHSTRLVYAYRDVRDVLTSLFQKDGEPEDQDVEGAWGATVRALVGEILDNHERWTACDNVLVSRYEDMHRDIAAEVRRIAQHVDVRVPDTEVAGIAERLSLTRQEQHVATFDYEANGAGRGPNRHDPATLLHRRHFNGAAVAKYREHFSREQIAFIETIAGDRLARHAYTRYERGG